MKSLSSRTDLFSKVLRERLNALGLDYVFLAAVLRLKQRNRVRYWVEGEGLPAPHHLHRIALVLHMDPLDLMKIWLGEPL